MENFSLPRLLCALRVLRGGKESERWLAANYRSGREGFGAAVLTQTIGQLVVRTKTLHPSDTVGKAAEAVQTSGIGAVPVLDNGLLIGLVTAPRITEYLATDLSTHGKERHVSDLLLDQAVTLPAGLTPQEALGFLRAHRLERAPVLDGGGGLLGMISLAELAAAVCGRVKPPLVGGMATPFGVYLTGGGVRGGVGDLALMSTGVYLATLNIAAVLLAQFVFGPGGWAYHLPTLGPQIAALKWPLFEFTWPLLFALFFRLSWITGYHAAEHQVVHTLEAGDDLRPEVVRQKPRVHPRCGTNLCAAVLIMQFFWENRGGSWDQLGLLSQAAIPMLITLFLWRRVGGWLQQNITTRPATLPQLESGIRAARELLERYQQPETRPKHTVFLRVWRMGMLQVLGGWMVVLAVLWLLGLVLPLPEALRIV